MKHVNRFMAKPYLKKNQIQLTNSIKHDNSRTKFNFPLSIITNSIFLPINKFNFFLSIITNFHKNTNNQKKKVIHGKTLPEGFVCVCVCEREREGGLT